MSKEKTITADELRKMIGTDRIQQRVDFVAAGDRSFEGIINATLTVLAEDLERS